VSLEDRQDLEIFHAVCVNGGGSSSSSSSSNWYGLEIYAIESRLCELLFFKFLSS
jgi:hypothetical protein